MIRAFIAIDIPEPVRGRIRDFLLPLRSLHADVKWVRPENLHLTLRFLGEIEPSRVSQVLQVMKEAVVEHRPFTIRLSGTGVFPEKGMPRVLWIGLDEGADVLQKLAEGLEGRLCRLGFAREDKPFTAHLTLGRVRSREGIGPLCEAFWRTPFVSEPFRVEETILFRSELKPDGPVYTVLGRVPIEG